MNVKIINVESKSVLNATILRKEEMKLQLPSFSDGWRFNFSKHSKKKGFRTYILCCNETPNIIEGCLIFEMLDNIEPYMAYIEVAPHNIGHKKQKENVAGCLIAFACRLSFIHGRGDYLGWLALDVREKTKEDEIKLMAIYSLKYNALKFGKTKMVIPPEGGQKLINEFLNS